MRIGDKGTGRRAIAFTLMELLVVIGIIAIVAALLLPVLVKGKLKARQVNCRSNLHQLGIAFRLYNDESDDMFPTPGSVGTYGSHAEDWIWWQFGRGVEKSAIAKYVSKFNPDLFTCPSDADAKWLQTQGFIKSEPYRYSFGITSFNLSNTFNSGMTTIITKDNKVFPFKSAWIKDPSAKIMLAEEARIGITNHNTSGVIGGNSPRWIPYGPVPNLISSRHEGKGDAVFADGHVEAVLPDFGTNRANTSPMN